MLPLYCSSRNVKPNHWGSEVMTSGPDSTKRCVATYRPVIAGDLDLICRHRHEMFKASGRSDAIVQPSTNAFKDWVKPRLDDGSYFGWIAGVDGIEVAGLGMTVIDWPPHPSHPLQARRGYVLNMFVEPFRRGQGFRGCVGEIAFWHFPDTAIGRRGIAKRKQISRERADASNRLQCGGSSRESVIGQQIAAKRPGTTRHRRKARQYP